MSDPCSHNRDMSTCCESCLLKRAENDQCMACGISNTRNSCSDECQTTITATMVRLYEENRILQVKYDALKANVAVSAVSTIYSPPYSPSESSYSPSYRLSTSACTPLYPPHAPLYPPNAPPYSQHAAYATTLHCPTTPNYCPSAPYYGTPYKGTYEGSEYGGKYDPIRDPIRDPYDDAKIAEYSAQSPTKKSRVSP